MTLKQRDLLQFIRDYRADNDGVTPSYDDMRSALGLQSKSGIHRIVVALERAGYLRRLPHRARTIVPIERGDNPGLHLAFTGLKETLNTNLARLAVLLTDQQRNAVNAAIADFEALLVTDQRPMLTADTTKQIEHSASEMKEPVLVQVEAA